ncbi:MAG: hypothetical protein ACFUZC_20810 [Chthoniobacteraceae bacterium]
MPWRPDLLCRGAALVIVLAFVVLLTGLLVAFFSRAVSDHQVALSSGNQTRSEIFAVSAVDTILGDLRQEIAAGSVIATVPSGKVYTPNAAATMVSAMVGTSGSAGTESLLKRSVFNLPFFSGTSYTTYSASNRAAQLSASGTSRNGRTILPSRWNSHGLLGLKSTSGAWDMTPVDAFTAPDWILVTRSGTNPIAWNKQWVASPKGNDDAVVGRFAYAIYNEGGLLDINQVGYPSNTTSAQKGQKGTVALADLTQIVPSNATGLTQAQVDLIVGWRNYATANPSGSLASGYTFDTTAAKRYFDYMTTATNGFLSANSSASPILGQTDQAFTSRRALIKFWRAKGFNPALLNYFATFSRGLEQPSFTPAANRPLVLSSASANVTGTGSGNDAYGLDATTVDGSGRDTSINPAFLKVTTTGTDGVLALTAAKRFPLSRLALLSHTSVAAKSDSDLIYRYFGLYRSDASQPWNYDHGNSTGILRLSEVTGREPDFFELLKAAIHVGSIGKGMFPYALTSPATMPNLQHYYRDTLVAMQILQIGSNVIDQYDSDDYPTPIQLAGDTAKVVYGVENLPYLYRIRPKVIHVTGTSGAHFVFPELWNPHAASSTAGASGPRSFRIRLQSFGAGILQIFYRPASGSWTSHKEFACDFDSGIAVNFNAGEGAGYYGFRDPTLLSETGKPASANLSVSDGRGLAGETPASSPERTWVGFPVLMSGSASFPWLDSNGLSAGRAFLKITSEVMLEYADGSNWIPYDHAYVDFNGSSFAGSATIGQYFHDDTRNWPDSTSGDAGCYLERLDPRTSRWFFAAGDKVDFINSIDSTVGSYETSRSASGRSLGFHKWGYADNGGPSTGGNGVNWYTNNQAAYGYGYRYGFLPENVIGLQVDGNKHYVLDPDGIARRGSSGYALDTASGGSTANSVGLPLLTTGTQSRPVILNRPFRSVAEMGYAFRDTPWKNIDFTFPESGDAALLDVFCLNELDNSTGLVAGRVDLNTRQPLVLQALLAGAVQDEFGSVSALSSAQCKDIAAALVARTTGTAGPLCNRAELVGRYAGGDPSDVDPSHRYSGFSQDLGGISSLRNPLASVMIPRLRQATLRALNDAGETRVWNLLIDVIAQVGVYPVNASGLDQFVVEGEKHYWVHVALDRLTGTILDEQIESVDE